MSSNYVQNVALVGAGGNQGKYIAEELVKGGKHKVTAITRAESNGVLPAGVVPQIVDYNDPASLVEGLRGQDVLIITMSVMAPPETHQKLIDAAKAAGVKFLLPNEWGYDHERDLKFAKENLIGERNLKRREDIDAAGLPWIAVAGGFWYEFSLGGGEYRYGFDIANREYTRINNGDIKLSTSTWEQVARGTVALLNLKIYPDNAVNKESTISNYFGKSVCIESFNISQNEMFESLKRVTGTTDADWKIKTEDSGERYARAIKMMQEGSRIGYGLGMYTRAFFPDGAASMPNTVNSVFNLPKEDLDECTKGAIKFEETFKGY
ncbi:hypothetical protein H072_10120 [Dactylellina haptotyla CBS 200.50]|uniref:NAD(P)-binding domain-containing protein n=1 Tax=Dactylellina haptotyla (strain CBS 200.50) TaxID=1284197 RepID=S8BB84_DACHA|nr:hypothetical protein H072_10120 [Dactylellina haptotyla CBS 200.50]